MAKTHLVIIIATFALSSNTFAFTTTCSQSDRARWTYQYTGEEGGPGNGPGDEEEHWFLNGVEQIIGGTWLEDQEVIGKRKVDCVQITTFTGSAELDAVGGIEEVDFDCFTRKYISDNKTCPPLR